MAASTTLEITLSAQENGLIRDWGLWEFLREILQNGRDEEARGHRLSVEHQNARGRASGMGVPIRVINEGSRLDREALLLGYTTKANDPSQLGRFGTGLKLAMLGICRLNKSYPQLSMVVKTHKEIWKPRIDISENFNNASLLKVDISPATPRDRVVVEIYGVSDEDWEKVVSRCLFLQTPDPSQVIDLGSDRILLSPMHQGRLFSKGIEVGPLSGNYRYGFDLSQVKLDHDRHMADSFSLEAELTKVMRLAIQTEKMAPNALLDMLEQSTGESKALYEVYRWSPRQDVLAEKITAAFETRYGKGTLPVTTMGEAARAEQHGITAAIVSEPTRVVVESMIGKFETKISNRGTESKKVYQPSELSPEEYDNLKWAVDVLSSVRPALTMDKIVVVDFYDSNVFGSCDLLPGIIRIAKSRLSARVELMGTLIHETAHLPGHADGSAEHRREIEKIAGEIIATHIPWLSEREKKMAKLESFSP